MRRTKAAGVRALGGGRYELRITFKNPKTGARVNAVRIRQARDVSDASRMRTEIRDEMRAALAGPAPAARVRLGDAAERWSEERAPHLKPSTRQTYGAALDSWSDELGAYYLDALTPADVRGTLAKWRASLSADSVNGRLRVLRTMLRDLGLSHAIESVEAHPRDAVREEELEDEGRGLEVHELAALLDEARSQLRVARAAAKLRYMQPHPCESGDELDAALAALEGE